LATRFSAFHRYQREEAWTWEHMALTRARPISGDADFRAQIETEIAEILTTEHERKKLAKDVRDMRQTLAKEKGEGDPWELKTAVGGLIDLEFIAQFLQLAHGHAHPEILNTTTTHVFEAAAHAKLLPQDDYELLRTATRLQHDLTQLLRLCLSESFDPKTAGAGLLALLARAGGAPDFTALAAELKDTQKAVRKLFTRLVTA
jgi:glutamate-ammonia-ligase adenylyltransferase